MSDDGDTQARGEALAISGKRYAVGERIWSGEYTERYEGQDPVGGKVILEVLRWVHRSSPDAVARFKLMVGLRAYLHHPSLVPVSDLIIGGSLGTSGVVSATGRGLYLSEVELPLPPNVVQLVAISMAHALAYLEAASEEMGVPLVHGGLDLEQVFSTNDGVVMVDGIGHFLFERWDAEGKEYAIRLGTFLATAFRPPTIQ